MTTLEEENLLRYGTIKVTPIPEHIVNERVSILNTYLEKLMSVDYMKQDNHRINKVLKDIKFWKKLGGSNETKDKT